MMWTEFEWKRYSIALAGKMPLGEDALAFSFRCALGKKNTFYSKRLKDVKTFRLLTTHRNGKGFIVRADEKLTAFVERQMAIHEFAVG